MQSTTTYSDRDGLQGEVHALIADSKKKAAAAQAAAADASDDGGYGGAQAKLPFTQMAPTEKEKAAIIPYQIIACISQLDNIYECRLLGWVLAKAQSVLKLYNKDLRDINLQHAMNVCKVTLPGRLLLNPGDKNYSNIGKAFTLATKTMSYERGGTMYHLNIIAFPELCKVNQRITVSFYIHSHFWHALLDFSRGHRLFSIPTFIKLTNKYSIIFYLLCSQQDTSPRSYTITRLRQILGCDKLKSYDRGNNFVQKVLDPARTELMTKAPYFFDYSLTKFGSAQKITEVILIPQPNPKYIQDGSAVGGKCAELRLRLSDQVRDYCKESFNADTATLERLEPYLTRLGDDAVQLQRLSKIKERMSLKRVRNPAGYLTRSLKNDQTTTT